MRRLGILVALAALMAGCTSTPKDGRVEIRDVATYYQFKAHNRKVMQDYYPSCRKANSKEYCDREAYKLMFTDDSVIISPSLKLRLINIGVDPSLP